MNQFQQFRTTMKEKSGKKLAAFTTLTTLLVICIVFPATMILNNYSKIKLLNKYIHEVPKIVNDFEDELDNRGQVFEEDILARGELGAAIYNEESSRPIDERLSKTRKTISADSVSLIDRNGKILNTTGVVTPMELFENQIEELEPGTFGSEMFPTYNKDGEETGERDGRAFVMLSSGEESGQKLIFEFSCEPLLEVYNDLDNWERILGRMLSGLNAYAFVQQGEDDPVGYPLDEFTEEERELIDEWIPGVFARSGHFLSLGSDTSYSLASFQHNIALVVMLPYPKMDAKILLVVPLWDLISTGLYSAVVLSVFVALSLILFTYYVLRRYGSKRSEEDREAFRRDSRSKSKSGRFVLIASIGCFSAMLLILENQSTIAFVGSTKRVELESDVRWHEEQKDIIESTYKNIYRTRTQALSSLLTESEEYRNRGSLREFCNTLKADYLMLFDGNGKELLSSNSYTDFSVGSADSNLSEEYKAVLLGYPYVVVGPKADPYTNKQQIGVAVLLTGDNGEADGFLLAVFGAESLNKELKRSNLENTVNSFSVAKGYKAAVINDEDGVFIAHTDAKKIGKSVEEYMGEKVYGDDFAGFTKYDGRNTYVSGVSNGGKSILFMVPTRSDDKEGLVVVAMIIALLLIIAFVYCPRACVLCTMAADEMIENSSEEILANQDRKSPLLVFAYGYAAFFTVLAMFAIPAAYYQFWPAFAFVFGGLWSKGVHLFSIWAVLFFVSITLSVVSFIRRTLGIAARRADLRTRTMIKLFDSFIAYATGILLVVGVLYMFGVNTTALLASEGIVSIAVGMGAQSMVSDILAGMFLTVEDSVHMGDVVKVGNWTGRVTDMGIRTTKITDDSQNTMILNNSRISDVVNMSRQKTSCVLELEIKRSVSMTETESILGDALAAASEEMPELYGSLKLDGIFNISPEGCTARLSYECAEVAREAVTKRLQEFVEKEVKKGMGKNAKNN